MATFEQQVLELTNKFRADNGLAPLKANAELNYSADKYAELMSEKRYFGHQGPDGTSPRQRMNAVGFDAQIVGENIARGQTTPMWERTLLVVKLHQNRLWMLGLRVPDTALICSGLNILNSVSVLRIIIGCKTLVAMIPTPKPISQLQALSQRQHPRQHPHPHQPQPHQHQHPHLLAHLNNRY